MRKLYLLRIILRLVRIFSILLAIWFGFDLIVQVIDIIIPRYQEISPVKILLLAALIALISFVTKKIKLVSKKIDGV